MRRNETWHTLWAHWALRGIVVIAVATLWTAKKPSAAEERRDRSSQHSGVGQSAVRAGKQTFESICATCHGLDGRGGQHGAGIARNPDVQSLSERALAEVIRNGIPAKGMPSFGFLGDRQIETLVGYIRVLASGLPQTVKGIPSQGEKLFFGKAGCSVCHMVAGKGGFIASDLSQFAKTHDAGEMHNVILRPGQVLGSRGQLVNVEMRDGSRLSGVIRNEDNFSLQLLSADGAFHLLMKHDILKLTPESSSLMPPDYGEKLTAREIEDVIAYLATVAGSRRAAGISRAARENKRD
jgi:cytochrome c oxidase cbb3-type subunit III